MIVNEPRYRIPELEEFVKGFTFQKYLKKSGSWVHQTLQSDPTETELELYLLLIDKGEVQVEYMIPVEYPDPEPEEEKIPVQDRFNQYIQQFINFRKKWFDPYGKYIYTGLFPILHILVAYLCYEWLDHMDVVYAATVDGTVMGTGTKLFQLAVFGLAAHLSIVSIANIVHWTLPGIGAYLYANPFIHNDETYDLKNDLNHPTNPEAKSRAQCYLDRFWRLYYVSLAIMGVVYTLKVYLESR